MAPETNENNEFTRWFEEWMARIQSNTVHPHEPSAQAASRREEGGLAPKERPQAAHAA